CMYCQDVGTYIWRCTSKDCGILVCVGTAKGDYGCVDAAPDDLTGCVKVEANTFRCPQCYRAGSLPVPYKIRGYAVRQEYTHRNYFPLLGVFLSWSGFGREYASDIVRRTLQEQFHLVPSRLRIASRKLKGGNNRPNTVKPDFEWLGSLNYEGNILIFIDTHSDTVTGDLVVSGNATNPNSLPVHEVSCTIYAMTSRLKRLVEMSVTVRMAYMSYARDIFDFIFCFAGVSTVDSLVVPALSRFVENVFVYNMGIWAALERSFGEDKHALNSTPVMLSFAEFQNLPDNTRQRVVDTRQFFGTKWLQTKMKTTCMECKQTRRKIATPSWIHACGTENIGRCWYQWPLTLTQRMDIGITQ
ncbi:hypothetical protein EV702DRAFT_985501, partial [Suillus placidus]